jgi:hypothetical protein
MIEKFAVAGGGGLSEFLGLNHTSSNLFSSVPLNSEVRS